MIEPTTALRLAIDVLHVPSRIRFVREGPLPDDMETLLRVAAGDAAALDCAAAALERAPAVIAQAAAFFIEQVLLAPDADAYRVLGSTPDATTPQLRHNMALLMRWVHPDVASTTDRSVFANRVTAAWESLKNDQRRSEYDGAERSPASQRDLESQPTKRNIATVSTSQDSGLPTRPGSQTRTRRRPKRRGGALAHTVRAWLGKER